MLLNDIQESRTHLEQLYKTMGGEEVWRLFILLFFSQTSPSPSLTSLSSSHSSVSSCFPFTLSSLLNSVRSSFFIFFNSNTIFSLQLPEECKENFKELQVHLSTVLDELCMIFVNHIDLVGPIRDVDQALSL